MSRHYSYLNTAATILRQYKGSEPFAASLKKFFAQQKKYGSKDRKQIAHLCYCFFRLGKSLTKKPVDERILTALFLCSTEPNEILAELKPVWNGIVHHSIKEKSAALPTADLPAGQAGSQLMTHIFPWVDELSEGIDHESFSSSFLSQPHLFLRVRPGHEKVVKEKLKHAGFLESVGRTITVAPDQKWMQLLGETCIALPNASKVEDIIELDKEAVVQDYSSQRIAGFLELVRPGRSDEFEVWDCCAASGGKSILAKDILGDIELVVSDIRETILLNLRKRFDKAGINHYRSFICDLTVAGSRLAFGKPSAAEGLPTANSRLILCDAPCTGSGTWGRTPEQLYFFEPSSIEKYSVLQRKIVSNVVNQLGKGDYFLYITCSVFKKENEEIVSFIKEKFHLKLVKMEFLKGYDQHADTMFAALFIASEV